MPGTLALVHATGRAASKEPHQSKLRVFFLIWPLAAALPLDEFVTQFGSASRSSSSYSSHESSLSSKHYYHGNGWHAFARRRPIAVIADESHFRSGGAARGDADVAARRHRSRRGAVQRAPHSREMQVVRRGQRIWLHHADHAAIGARIQHEVRGSARNLIAR